ncbi:L-seryl-tRNA(Sec) selenium transferase [Citrifermentans bemidjiense Bem]|uniref:L-seryl-tRNA(Sec) selenium transferase n=1 Tax=Citrifermentans bemidjiense (strain ATCC BAA-1014 / DSM 16622 / JCM 12645 / Bem) TaxID=404380 RepID=B5EEK2_CITBB|nr:L-seryl-tRNA(Sec) selenium transferase [Citrifermentans bemidjiense]ACH40788.1 L-seryl-tRNA(Sec) selenium transferase [Citrifermentans bemidjiense Bem]
MQEEVPVQQLKMIPKVDRVLEWEAVRKLLATYPRELVLRAVRSVLDKLRSGARAGGLDDSAFLEPAVCAAVAHELAQLSRPSLQRVINGSGIVIHTNLGRSILPEAARNALNTIAFSYSNLEFDLEAGVRGSRYSHVEALLCELTGAEAAIVVNNNAAAVLLSLSSMAAGREAVVSRGELVEIGGSFRIPEVMRLSGVTLREVGTTNRTHPRDYSSAANEQTAVFLKVHCSNFAVLGFTAEVTAQELVALGAAAGVPVLADMGSGNLIDLSGRLPVPEPTVQEFVRAGVDVITFSGDKLLGGPQAGIIVGKKPFIEAMKKHQLLRALRMDKLTLASLEATLALYRDEMVALKEVPTLRMLTATLPELTARAKKISAFLRRRTPQGISFKLSEGFSQAGGGTLPLLNLPSMLIEVAVEGLSPNDIESRLRKSEIPVIGRINKNAFLLDPRTLLDSDLSDLAAAISALAG